MISLEHVRRQKAELRRLFEPPGDDEKPEGMGIVRFDASCSDGAIRCLERVREVLSVVLRNSLDEWPADERWRTLIPKWFVDRCASERSKEESQEWMKRWRAMSAGEQARVEKEEAWPLSNWLYWFKPEERYWRWWDALAENETTLKVAVTVDDWPFPWGSLRWLLRACGARDVESEK